MSKDPGLVLVKRENAQFDSFSDHELIKNSKIQCAGLEKEFKKLSSDPKKNSERLEAIREELKIMANELLKAYNSCFVVRTGHKLSSALSICNTLSDEIRCCLVSGSIPFDIPKDFNQHGEKK